MKIHTTWNTEANTATAVHMAYNNLKNELGRSPDLLIVYTSIRHDGETIMSILSDLAPNTPLQGGTSCLGVMTADGFHSANGTGLGLFGICDEAGDYGVGVSQIGDDPRAAGAKAIQQAVVNAKRPGELPDLIWLSGVPGSEEMVLLGIQDTVGPDVPIAGGSTADNKVQGKWQQFANGQVYTDAVVVTAMYPSVNTHLAFHSGYSPTEYTGQVTRAEGRTLYEINDCSAAQVYNKWTNGSINEFLDGGNVLSSTTLYPLGRFVGEVGNMPYHRLSHPDSVTPEGALTLFSNINVGEQITLMHGTRRSLVRRAGRVARAALGAGHITADQISGALIIYCAGCMLTVQDEMEQVAAEIRMALGNKPFMGAFTFGEQGCFLGGENHHGNLMISVVVFE